jgi:hypothetical protein
MRVEMLRALVVVVAAVQVVLALLVQRITVVQEVTGLLRIQLGTQQLVLELFLEEFTILQVVVLEEETLLLGLVD